MHLDFEDYYLIKKLRSTKEQTSMIVFLAYSLVNYLTVFAKSLSHQVKAAVLFKETSCLLFISFEYL